MTQHGEFMVHQELHALFGSGPHTIAEYINEFIPLHGEQCYFLPEFCQRLFQGAVPVAEPAQLVDGLWAIHVEEEGGGHGVF